MRNIVGNVVEGDDFFDREAIQKIAWLRLQADNLLLLAPRRIGKTSLMRKLIATAHEHDFQHAIEVTFADCHDELGCMLAILEAIEKQLPTSSKLFDNLKEQLSKIKGLEVSTTGFSWSREEGSLANWRETGEGIATALSQLDGQSLICADEVPLFILQKLLDNGSDAGRQRTRDFLNWFRTLRQEHNKNVRWVLAGSIGLDTVAQRFGLTDSINDLQLFPIGAFDPQTADDFLKNLGEASELPLDDATRQAVLKRLDWPLPYYLQVVFSKLQERKILDQEEPSPVAVEKVFDDLLSPAYDNYFDYWRQRLEDELGQPDAGHAIELLNRIAADPNGAIDTTLEQALQARISNSNSVEKTFRFLIGVLNRDGYIVEAKVEGESRRWRFQLSLLRDWWRQQ